MALTDALLLEPAPFEVWVALRSQKGSGTLNDPYGVASTSDFDTLMTTLMSSFPNGTTIHLGPGEFTTAGYTDGPPVAGWQIKPKIRILGSGRDITTLKLVVTNPASAQQFFAIGHDLGAGACDFCEIGAMTIDCNIANLGANVSAAAVRLMGNHVRVRGIKVKNWGTKTSSKPCFVVSVITAYPSLDLELNNAGIEDCVAVDPSSSALAAPIMVFHAGGKEDAGVNKEGYGKVPFIRNCFVDCGNLSDPITADIRALSIGWCRGGIVEGNQIHNVRYGGPYQDKATSRDVIVRGNLYKNVLKAGFWNLGLQNAPAALSVSLSLSSSNPPLALATATGHGLQVGDHVKISADNGDANYKGVFVVIEVPATNQFKYQMASVPSGSAPTTNVTYQKVFGFSNLLVERNVIELATLTTGLPIGIHISDNNLSLQTPDYTHTEAIVRGNHIRYLNGLFDSNYKGEGVRVEGVKNAIVRDNVLECAPVNPLKEFRCGTAKFFNNKAPSGALIQGYDGDTTLKYSELETEAEDALLMTLL